MPAEIGAATSTTLRRLVASGELARTVPEMASDEIVALRRAAYAIAWPLVYDHHTRVVERRKSHWECATSIDRMAASCMDGFEDDVEAVVDHLFVHANRPVANLEGWLVSRLTVATVDGYRRRRGDIGAQQRPRVPVWLARRLGSDPWLVALAARILDWVGVSATAGYDTWPTAEWTMLRAAMTGPSATCGDEIGRQIEQVLTTMREGRPGWYEQYVERPLGRKQTPVGPGPVSPTSGEPWPPLVTVTRDERDDARLAQLATAALAAIEGRLDSGQDPEIAVTAVVEALFLGPAALADDLDLAPGAPASDRSAALSAALVDPAQTRRIVHEVLEIVTPRLRVAEQ